MGAVYFFAYAAKMRKSESAARAGTGGGKRRIFCCLNQIACCGMEKWNGGVAKKLVNRAQAVNVSFNRCRSKAAIRDAPEHKTID